MTIFNTLKYVCQQYSAAVWMLPLSLSFSLGFKQSAVVRVSEQLKWKCLQATCRLCVTAKAEMCAAPPPTQPDPVHFFLYHSFHLSCTLSRSSAVKPDLSFTVIGSYVKQTGLRSHSQDQGRKTEQNNSPVSVEYSTFSYFYIFFYIQKQCSFNLMTHLQMANIKKMFDFYHVNHMDDVFLVSVGPIWLTPSRFIDMIKGTIH